MATWVSYCHHVGMLTVSLLAFFLLDQHSSFDSWEGGGKNTETVVVLWPQGPRATIIRWRSYWAIVTFYAVWSIDGDWRREAVRNRQANDWSTQRNRQTLMKGRYIHREGSTCTHTKKRMKKEIKTNRKNEEDFKVEKQNNLYLLDVGGTCRSKFEFLTSQLGMCTTLAYSRETHIRRKSGYHQVRDGNEFARQRRRGPRCMWLAADGLAASLRAVATCIIYA